MLPYVLDKQIPHFPHTSSSASTKCLQIYLFSHNLSLGLDKLLTQSLKYVFLGLYHNLSILNYVLSLFLLQSPLFILLFSLLNLSHKKFNIPLPYICKGTCSTHKPLPLYIALSYHRLSPLHYICFSSLLFDSGTWELIHLPFEKSIVRCRWLYTIKVGPDDKIDHFKTHMITLRLSHLWKKCRWLYTIKVGPDDKIDHFKTQLVDKGHSPLASVPTKH
ncbi:hypothetical protein CR513_32381, partial [Mucuna pruriens]